MSALITLKLEAFGPSDGETTPSSSKSPRLTAVLAEALSDEFSRRIMSSSILEGKTVKEICSQENIPESTCYRKLNHLVEEGVMVVERIALIPAGKKHVIYRSAFSSVRVKLVDGVLSAEIAVNPDVADKLQRADIEGNLVRTRGLLA